MNMESEEETNLLEQIFNVGKTGCYGNKASSDRFTLLLRSNGAGFNPFIGW